MKEHDLKNLAIIEIQHDFSNIVLWVAPKYKILSWDIFGIFDLIGIQNYNKISFFQITTAPNLSARRKKIYGFMAKNNIFNFPSAWIYSYNTHNRKWGKELIGVL